MSCKRPLLGVSACLLGQPVRYDGNHKHCPALEEHLRPFCDLLPLCPEMEAGWGTPRTPVQLILHQGVVRVLEDHPMQRDLTEALDQACQQTIHRLMAQQVNGFILKSRSPSCGWNSTPLLGASGQPLTHGRLVHGLLEVNPHIPLIDEIQWQHPASRARFMERIGLRNHDCLP
jgi:uncharacterized protein YbbK (DUF523 family)